jgi:ketosteroid isomerase-like protein
MTGTHKGPLKSTSGKTIPPTNKQFRIDLAITLRFEGGKIAEEHIYYDRLGMLTQLGVSP